MVSIRSFGWPFAYQWGPLPRGYRSYGIRWLALAADVLIATTLSGVLAFSISWLARRRALKKPELNSAEQRSEES